MDGLASPMRVTEPAAAPLATPPSGRVVGVVGLGYVGLPVALAFRRAGLRVIGFDIDARRVEELNQGLDRTREVRAEALRAAALRCTADPSELGEADAFVVTVPTPLTSARQPDFGPLLRATETVGRALRKGALVIYESTVHPGATEEICLPRLEAVSGLRGGRDFAIAYSPERINPGDPAHGLESVTKLVAAQQPEVLEEVASLYARIVPAGVHRVASIRIAEAAKVIENAQRDVNIAFVNEMACILGELGLDTRDVLDAAATKWNFLRFQPGLVGGHCVGVDPLYLAHRAREAGHQAELVLTGRRVNDAMPRLVARRCVQMLMRGGGASRRVTLLGLTFKEDVADLRNAPSFEILRELRLHGLDVQLADPLADPAEVLAQAGLAPAAAADLRPGGAVILAVAHRAFAAAGWPLVQRCLVDGCGAVLDVKGCLDRARMPAGIDLWRL